MLLHTHGQYLMLQSPAAFVSHSLGNRLVSIRVLLAVLRSRSQ